MMKTIFLTAAMAMFFFNTGKTQYYFYNNKYYQNSIETELGIGAGLMNALTDLGGKKGIGKNAFKDLTWKTARLSYSLYAVAVYKNAIGIKLETTFGSITGYDSILRKVAASTSGRYERHLSFKSNITDLQLGIELHPLFIFNFDQDNPPSFSPYAITGIGYYSFNPQANLNGLWFALQPLRTEGQGFTEYPQRKSYKLHQLNIAAGAGIKFELKNSLHLRFEVVHRFLNTDYLDDVSMDYVNPALFPLYLPARQAFIAQQLYNRKKEINPLEETVAGDQRGDPSDNDAFFTVQFKIGMVIGRKRRTY